MNIFFLDTDIKKCAQYHCDKHVVKMILEYAQLLSTAHHLIDGPKDGIYAATHKNHPMAIWTRDSIENYSFVYSLLVALCDEYTLRYKKIHKTSTLLPLLNEAPRNLLYFTNGYSVPLCMPDDCKEKDAVTSYRNYYKKYKKDIAVWKYTETPEWFK
jgi:hypothetical protein